MWAPRARAGSPTGVGPPPAANFARGRRRAAALAARPRADAPLPTRSGMRRSPDVSPRRLSDISPQLRQLKYLVVDEAIKEDLKWSRSVEDLTSASVGLTSIEERILRITGYYGYQPWAASYKRESPARAGVGGCQDGGLRAQPGTGRGMWARGADRFTAGTNLAPWKEVLSLSAKNSVPVLP